MMTPPTGVQLRVPTETACHPRAAVATSVWRYPRPPYSVRALSRPRVPRPPHPQALMRRLSPTPAYANHRDLKREQLEPLEQLGQLEQREQLEPLEPLE